MTTEHFVLQRARAATIAESNGRANMVRAAVYGGLVALASFVWARYPYSRRPAR